MIQRRGILLLHDETGDFWLDRLAASGLNLVGIHPAGGDAAPQSLDEAIGLARTPAFRSFYHALAARGIDVEFEAHALAWMLPRSMFPEHPQWFRMNAAGERTPDFNFCAGNPDAIAWIEGRAEQLVRLLVPTTNRYFFWSDDVAGDCFCHCEACRAYSPSEQYMLFSNAVLRGLRRVNPHAKHAYIAYHATMPAPRKVEPEEGIFLEYAPIRRDQYIPIDDPDCEANRREIASIGELISCFGKTDAQVLEYWMDNTRFSGYRRPLRKYQFDAEIMRRDVAFYLQRGFTSLTSFGCWLGEEYFNRYGEPPVMEYARVFERFR